MSKAMIRKLKREIVTNNTMKGVNRGRRDNPKKPRTFSQVRKHVTQMTKEEVDECIVMLNFFKPNAKLSQHLIKRKHVQFDVNDIDNKLNGTSKSLKKSLVDYSERYIDGVWMQRITILVANKEVYFDNDKGASKGHLEVCFDITHRRVLTAYFREYNDDSRLVKNIKDFEDIYIPELEVRDFKKGGYLFSNKGLDDELIEFYDSVYKEVEGDELAHKISGIHDKEEGMWEVKKEYYLRNYVKTGFGGLDYDKINLVEEIEVYKGLVGELQQKYTYPITVDVRVEDVKSKHKVVYIVDDEDGYSDVREEVINLLRGKPYSATVYYINRNNNGYDLGIVVITKEQYNIKFNTKYVEGNKNKSKKTWARSICMSFTERGLEVHESEGGDSVFKKYDFSKTDILEKRLPKLVGNTFEVHTNGDVYTFIGGVKEFCKEIKKYGRTVLVGYNRVSKEEERQYKEVLLATAFIPNTKKRYYVGFKDGDLKNFSLNNIEWISRKEFKRREIKRQRGIASNITCSECGNNAIKVNIRDIGICNRCYNKLKEDSKGREKVKELEKRYKIKKSVEHIPLDELTKKQREKIELRSEGKVYTEIAEELGITYQVVGASILSVLRKYPSEEDVGF